METMKKPGKTVNLIGSMIILCLGVSLTACIPIIKDNDNDGENVITPRSMLQTGIYFFWVYFWDDEIDAGYGFAHDTNGQVISEEMSWNDSSKSWEKYETEGNDGYISESIRLMYVDGKWEEVFRVDDDSESESITYTSSGNAIIPTSMGLLALGLQQVVDLSGDLLTDYDSNLVSLVPEDASFDNGSYKFLLTNEILKDHMKFSLKYRGCDKNNALLGTDGIYTCADDDWYENTEGVTASFSEFRDGHNTIDEYQSLYPYIYHFESGTNNIIIYQRYNVVGDNEERVSPPELLDVKGTWAEVLVGGINVMTITFPDLSDRNVSPLEQEAWVLYNGKVYQGTKYIEGEFANNDDEFFWLNEIAVFSIVDVFNPNSSQAKLSALSKKKFKNSLLKSAVLRRLGLKHPLL
ncbi:MAG: hypothetical protein HQK83_07630 [Fibrobacteria bacterium]|nr:hypothetical protein [Fibrobacteria bacterium]